ncbi:MAG: hypothetical protein LBH43_18315 [Treponema sp.]|jgi:hypothetical protein|nr:hypothetical protein [Treponema sp.]
MKAFLRTLGIIALTALVAFSMTACGDGGDNTHNHDYSGEWQKDAAYHWKVCPTDNEIGEKAAHTPPDGVCTTCAYDNTPHTYDYSGEWQKDAAYH